MYFLRTSPHNSCKFPIHIPEWFQIFLVLVFFCQKNKSVLGFLEALWWAPHSLKIDKFRSKLLRKLKSTKYWIIVYLKMVLITKGQINWKNSYTATIWGGVSHNHSFVQNSGNRKFSFGGLLVNTPSTNGHCFSYFEMD